MCDLWLRFSGFLGCGLSTVLILYMVAADIEDRRRKRKRGPVVKLKGSALGDVRAVVVFASTKSCGPEVQAMIDRAMDALEEKP